jgi:molybdenum cofactor biosynthesis protein B
MTFSEHERHRKVRAKVAVITVSDSRDEESDASGKAAESLLISDGHEVVFRRIVKNDVDTIRALVWELAQDPKLEVILTLGGTGISSRDVTVEAVSNLFDKSIEGFGELFRRLSYEDIGEAAMLSRAIAGTVSGKVVFCLPGSKSAIELALQRLILPGLGHALWEANR